MHGGKAPQVVVAAARRAEVARVEAVAQQVLEDRGTKPLTVRGTFKALLDLAGEVDEWRRIMRDHVGALRAIRYEAHGAGTEQLRAEVQLYERALDRCAKVLGLVAGINPDERLRRLDEEQGALVVAALERIFDGLQLSGAQRSLIPSVVPKALREIAAEAES